MPGRRGLGRGPPVMGREARVASAWSSLEVEPNIRESIDPALVAGPVAVALLFTSQAALQKPVRVLFYS